MRPTWFRVVRPLVLSLVILSCATENAVGPTVSRVNRGASVVGIAPTPAKVVISQVYGGGGNTGAPLNRDFVELFNAGGTEQDLSGWSIQYASAQGNGNFGVANQIAPLRGTIQPGEYVLVSGASGSVGTAFLADIDPIAPITPINLSGTNGKVALVASSTSLGCNGGSTPCNAAAMALIVDLVGYGTSASAGANFYETTGSTPPTTAAPTLTNGTAALRKDHGCTDTNNNGADFAVPAGTSAPAPAPRSRATSHNPCVPIVPAGPVVSVTISPEDGSVRKGSTLQLSAVGKDADDNVSPTAFTWVSSNTGVVSISTTGLATGMSEGTVDVTVTSANGVSATTTLSVAEGAGAASVSISINTPRQAPVGYTKPSFPTVKDADGNLITTSTTLTWSTSNGNATVDNLGYVTGVAAGSVTIRATAPNGVFGTSSFTVLPGDAATSAVYGNHLEFGAPVATTGPGGILLEKRQYVESYNPGRGGPNWVSWEINSTQFGAAPRCDCFSADQTLPSSVYHVVDFDYRDGKYDRGHMVQSESRTATDQENASTFLLTNILPQGAENNQGPWSKFENYLNDQARATNGVASKHEVYVVAGGIYSATPATLKGEGKVAIPDYTWKVAVVMPAGKGLADVRSPSDLEVIAIKMPNLITTGVAATSVGIRNNPWEQYKTTVDEIERETGYDFLSKLPDNIEVLVEANDRPPVAAWSQPQATAEGTAIDFDASASSDPDDGDALTYAWDFGDGTAGSGATVSHAFRDNGNYEVTLTVRDRAGAENTLTHSVVVSNVAPGATFSNNGPVVEGSAIALSLGSPHDPSSSDFSAGFEYRFDCGDGFGDWSSSNTASCPTTDNPGFNVRGEIRDKDKGVSSYDGFGTVTNAKPSVVIATPSPIYSGQTFSLSAGFADLGQQDSPWNFTINWGNGTETGSTSTQGAVSRSRTYTAAGSYTLSIAVTDKDGGTGTATASLRVLRLPTALGVNPAQINTINKGVGQVVVTVFGSSSFGGDLIDIGSIRINGVRPDLRGNDDAKSAVEDRDGDGIADLVVHFERSALVSGGALNAGTTELVLQANLTDSRQIEARGPVNIATRD